MTTKQNRVISPTDEAYSEWQMAYDHFNQALFGNILPYCLITLQREKHTMGYFSSDRFANRSGRKTDEIAINPSYFAVCGVDEALQTLVHEMCHLWQHHFGSPGRGRYHNKQWADFMENIGMMPSHTGAPGGRRTGDKIADYIIPGGPMEASIVDLKGEGFELQWMDRFVAKPMTEIEPYFQVLTGTDDNAYHTTGISDETIEEIRSIAEVIDLDLTRTTQKQGGRVKYACQCTINIWARPNIHVTCDDCGMPFAAV